MDLEGTVPADRRDLPWWRAPTQAQLILLAAAYLVATANLRFFRESARAFPIRDGNLGFLISVAVLLFSVLVLLLALGSGRYTTKPLVCLFLVVAAPVAYFSDRLGVIVDSTMILNVVETDVREAGELLSLELVARVVLLGVLPAVTVWRMPLRYRPWRAELLRRAALVVVPVATVALTIPAFGGHYASYFREYRSVRRYANPVAPLVATVRLARQRSASLDTAPPDVVAIDAHLPADDPDRELMILVIGETARADRFQLYGYERATTPELLREERLFVYPHVSSCGTSTAVSVPCMFSFDDRRVFDVHEARHRQNVLDVLQRAGVAVLWRDNNSGSKGVALRVPYEDFRSSDVNPVCDPECRDVGMLSGLQSYIDGQDGDVLIVLHQMGNHGPAYHRRYPAEFERFTPACHSAKLSDCSREEIDNAYDNAILYTDWFLARVIELLERNATEFEAAMIYVSDHGESLGENNVFLHGLPYSIAPAEQTTVPFLLWVGERRDVDLDSVPARAATTDSHDAIVDSLLTYFEVESEALEDARSAFSLSHASDPRR